MDPAARKLLELALPQLHDYALILLDPEGKVLAWLCGAQDILGYAPEEMIGRSLAGLLVEEDRAEGIDSYELELARENSTSHDDRWHVRKDTTRIWASGTVTALRQDGQLLGYAKVLRDRTDLRMASEARANELSGTRAELAGLRDFVSTLAHELRHPLTPIRHSVNLLRRLLEGPKVRHATESIASQSALIERLTSDLIDVSRLETGSLKLRRSEIDVCPLLRDEAAAQKLAAAAKQVKLVEVLPHCPLHVHGDPDRLRQAIRNLLVNAVKYTPPHGSIWVKATHEDNEVVIRIEDTGIGIDPGALPRIFELFTREQRAREVAPGYLGVGLALVRHIARLHGGVVQARSGGVGKGAEFTLRLPRPAPAGE